MRGNFERCLAITLAHEGGWSDHPQDPGGATMKGVTLATYRQFRPGASPQDLRAITDADLGRIYREGYWEKVCGDDLAAGLDLVAFDGAVNSGPVRGAKWVQAALGVSADGKIGPRTLAKAGRAGADAINAACDLRLSFLRGLPSWPTFGKGWARRVEAVRSEALFMAREATRGLADPVRPHWLDRLLAILTHVLGGAK